MQEDWSRLPFPPPEDLPSPGMEPTLQADSLPLSHGGSPFIVEHFLNRTQQNSLEK